MRANLDLTHGALHAERAQWALVPAVGRARAAELVRDALGGPDFVAALLARLGDTDPSAAQRVRAVTATGGPVGLSDRMIDAVLADARSRS
jgi:hypothetical protein